MNAAAPRSRGGGKVAGRPTASRILHQKGPGAVPGAAMGQVYAWGGIRIRSRGAAGGGTSPCRRAAGGWRNRNTQPAPEGRGHQFPLSIPKTAEEGSQALMQPHYQPQNHPVFTQNYFSQPPDPHRHPTCHGKRQAGENQRAGAERAEPLNIYTACHQPPGEEVATVQFQHKQHNNFFA